MDYITPSDACKILGVSEATFQNMHKRGDLSSIPVGYDRAATEAMAAVIRAQKEAERELYSSDFPEGAVRMTLVPAPTEETVSGGGNSARGYDIGIDWMDARGEVSGVISMYINLKRDGLPARLSHLTSTPEAAYVTRNRAHVLQGLYTAVGLGDAPVKEVEGVYCVNVKKALRELREVVKSGAVAISAMVHDDSTAHVFVLVPESMYSVDVPEDAPVDLDLFADEPAYLVPPPPPAEPKPAPAPAPKREEPPAQLFMDQPGNAHRMDWIDHDMDSMIRAKAMHEKLKDAGWTIEHQGEDDHCELYEYNRDFASGHQAVEAVSSEDVLGDFTWYPADGIIDEREHSVEVSVTKDGTAIMKVESSPVRSAYSSSNW